MLIEPLKHTGFCIVKRGVADHRLFLSVGFIQLPRVGEDVSWYLSWLNDMECSVNNLSSLTHRSDKPKWTFILNKSQNRGVEDHKLGLRRFFSTSFGTEEALARSPERCAAGKSVKILDARLEHTMAFLQVCRQHLVARKISMPQSGGRILVTSRRCMLRRLHSNLENAFWTEVNEEQPDEMKAESQAAGYLAMASGRFKMLLQICERSHRKVRAAHQGRVKKLRRVSVVRLVKKLPFSVLVVKSDIFYAGPAWTYDHGAFT